MKEFPSILEGTATEPRGGERLGAIQHERALSAEEIARIALGCVIEGKASDVRVLDVHAATILADYFIIASVSNVRQAAAIGERVHEELKKRGVLPLGREGREHGWWVLADYGSVIVHVMQAEARLYYDLDNYWGESPEITLEPIQPSEEAA